MSFGGQDRSVEGALALRIAELLDAKVNSMGLDLP